MTRLETIRTIIHRLMNEGIYAYTYKEAYEVASFLYEMGVKA